MDSAALIYAMWVRVWLLSAFFACLIVVMLTIAVAIFLDWEKHLG